MPRFRVLAGVSILLVLTFIPMLCDREGGGTKSTDEPRIQIGASLIGTSSMSGSANQDIAITEVRNASSSTVKLSRATIVVEGAVDVVGLYYEPPQQGYSGAAGGLVPSPLRLRNGHEVHLLEIRKNPELKPGESGYILARIRLLPGMDSAAILHVDMLMSFQNGPSYPLIVPMPVAICRRAISTPECMAAQKSVRQYASLLKL